MGRRDPVTRASRFLALHLRHTPQDIGLTLDREGWASVDAVLRGARAAGYDMRREDIAAVLAMPGKQRYQLDDRGLRIRAMHGHSVPVDLGYVPGDPPAVLYHGTVDRFVDAIFRQGLLPRSRQQVHLAGDREMALTVGGRRGEPVLLTVDAQAMVADGHIFYHSPGGVWLTDQVPPKYLRRLDSLSPGDEVVREPRVRA